MQRSRTAVFGLAAAVAGIMMGCETYRLSSTNDSKPQSSQTVALGEMEGEREVSRKTIGWPTSGKDQSLKWSTVAYPTGEARTSAIGIEKGVPSRARVDQPFEYEIIVTNLTNHTLHEVTLSESLSQGFGFVSATPKPVSADSQKVNWALGDFDKNESKTIRIRASGANEGTVGTCASVRYNELLCSAVSIVKPNLLLTMSGPSQVIRCDDITYRFNVRNNGSGEVNDVRVRQTLPDGLMTLDGRKTIDLNVGTLGAGQSKELTAKVKADRPGEFTVMANAVGDGNITAKSSEVATIVTQPELKITATSREKQYIGRPTTVEYTVTNTGDGVATNTVLRQPVPAAASIDRIGANGQRDSGNIVWNIGDLRPGQSRTVDVTYNYSAEGTLSSGATVTSYCAEARTASAQTVYRGIPAILLEVVDVSDPVVIGDTTTYIVTVTNQGTTAANNVTVVCELEDEMKFISADGTTRGRLMGQTVSFEPLRALAPKEKAVWRVTVEALSEGDVRFSAKLTSEMINRPVDETEATNFYK